MKKEKIYLILIILLSVFTRFFCLSVRPFDGDEGIMVLIAKGSWQELFARASLDVHPPLYHILLKLFINFGISTWAVRLVSAICGILFVYFIYIFSKKILVKCFSKSCEKISLICALLAAISPYLLYPSQEARMYSLFAFLVLGSYYFYLDLIEKNSWKNWLGYILFSAAMIYTQYLGFIVIFSQVVYLLIFERGFGKKIWQWFISWIIIALIFIPQLPIMIRQFSGRVSEQSQNISIMENIKSMIGALYRFGAGRIFLDLSPSHIKTLLMSDPVSFIIFLLTFIIPLVLLITGIISIYKKSAKIFWFLLIPVAISVFAGLLVGEIGAKASRYFIYLAPFYLLLVGIGFTIFWQKSWKIIFPIGMIIISLYSCCDHYFRESKALGVNDIANYICQNQGKNDIVIIRGGFGGGEEWVFDYYDQNCPKKITSFDLLGAYQTGNLAELKAVNPIDKAKKMLVTYQTVWFYDLTYSNYDFSKISGEYNVSIIDLGKDKENKDLILWKITK